MLVLILTAALTFGLGTGAFADMKNGKAALDISFETDSFSVYGIVGTEAEPDEEVRFTGTCRGMDVCVYAAEDTFPAGTEMKLVPVNAEEVFDAVYEALGGVPEILFALDISFWLDGMEIEPQEQVTVKLAAKALEESEEVKVLHIEEDTGGAVILDGPDTDPQGEVPAVHEALFETDSFSPFTVAGVTYTISDDMAVEDFESITESFEHTLKLIHLDETVEDITGSTSIITVEDTDTISFTMDYSIRDGADVINNHTWYRHYVGSAIQDFTGIMMDSTGYRVIGLVKYENGWLNIAFINRSFINSNDRIGTYSIVRTVDQTAIDESMPRTVDGVLLVKESEPPEAAVALTKNAAGPVYEQNGEHFQDFSVVMQVVGSDVDCTLTDSMGQYLTLVPGSISAKYNDLPFSDYSTDTGTPSNGFTLSFEGLNEEPAVYGTVEVTYTVRVDKNAFTQYKENDDKRINTVTVEGDVPPATDSAEADAEPEIWAVKSGEFNGDLANPVVTWTINLNPDLEHPSDLSGTVISDSLGIAGGQTYQAGSARLEYFDTGTGSWVEIEEAAAELDSALEGLSSAADTTIYTLPPDAGTKQYRITYNTIPQYLAGYLENVVHLTKDGVQAAADAKVLFASEFSWIKKNCLTTAGSASIVEWEITVMGNEAGLTNAVVKDTIPTGMTYDTAHAVYIVPEKTDPAYSGTLHTTVSGQNVTLDIGQVPAQGSGNENEGLVTIHLTTTVDDPESIVSKAFVNMASLTADGVPLQDTSAEYDYRSTRILYKEGMGYGMGTNSFGTNDHVPDGNYFMWGLNIYNPFPDDAETVRIVDVIPEYFDYDGIKQFEGRSTPSGAYQSRDYTSYFIDLFDVTEETDDLGRKLAVFTLNGNSRVREFNSLCKSLIWGRYPNGILSIWIKTKLNRQMHTGNTNTAPTSYDIRTIRNDAYLEIDEVHQDDTSVTRSAYFNKLFYLKKNMTQVQNSGFFDCEILVNRLQADLVTDSDTVTFEDIIGKGLTYVPGSLQVKKWLSNTQSEVLPLASLNPVFETQTDGGTKLTMTVPDQTSLSILYRVEATGPLTGSGNTTNTADYDNTAYLNGLFYKADVRNKNIHGTGGWLSGSNGLMLYKYDVDDERQGLNGASFHIRSICRVNTNAYGNMTGVSPITEGEDGYLDKTVSTADQSEYGYGNGFALERISADVLYQIVETSPPENYRLDETPRYVIICSDDNLSSLTFEGVTYSDIQRVEAAVAGVSIPNVSAVPHDLTVSKNVVVPSGYTPDEGQEFTFVIEMRSEIPEDLTTYPYIRTGNDQEVTEGVIDLSSGSATIVLKHGESITIPALPSTAACTVTENVPNGYEVSNKVTTLSGGTVENMSSTTGELNMRRGDVRVSFSNEQTIRMTTIRILKTDEDENTALPGVAFALYTAADVVDGRPKPGSMAYETGETDAGGTLMLRNLESGTYCLFETGPPEGFVGLAEPITFTLDAGGIHCDTLTFSTSADQEADYEAVIVNKREKFGALEITKSVIVNGETTLTTLADGEYFFTITDGNGLPATGMVNGAPIEDGKVMVTVTNGEANTVRVTDLPVGTYTVSEDTPNNGTLPVKINNTAVSGGTGSTEVQIEEDQAAVVSFSNNLDLTIPFETREIYVKKEWYGPDGEEMSSADTEQMAVTYRITQYRAEDAAHSAELMALDGQEVIEYLEGRQDISFEETGYADIELTAVAEKIVFVMNGITYSADNEGWLSHVTHLPLYEQKDDKFYVYRYAVSEVEAEGEPVTMTGSTGTSCLGSVEITADAHGNVTIKNTMVALDISVRKVDKANEEKLLTGAGFRLARYESGSYQNMTGIWDETEVGTEGEEKGRLVFEGLTPGFYELMETAVPDGYVRTGVNPRFEVKYEAGRLSVDFTDTEMASYDADSFTFTVKNEAGKALPSTGGTGIRLFSILGAILMIGAGVFLVIRHRMYAWQD